MNDIDKLAGDFWRRVRVLGPNDCWVWLRRDGSPSLSYGSFYSREPKIRAVAHRFSWELTNGPIPPGLLVCHRCDNPPCCNPAHLFIGTQLDNMADCVAKGRRKILREQRKAAGPPPKKERLWGFPEILTPDEAAAILGIDGQTIHQMAMDGKIAHIRFTKKIIRFVKSDLVAKGGAPDVPR